MNALANPEVGKYFEEYFVSAFQRVGTFKIVGKAKQGGNVVTYFCAPDGRVLHAIAGPVDAATLLREAKWVVETTQKAMDECKDDGVKFKAYFRKAHADKLKAESGLTVEPATFDAPADQDHAPHPDGCPGPHAHPHGGADEYAGTDEHADQDPGAAHGDQHVRAHGHTHVERSRGHGRRRHRLRPQRSQLQRRHGGRHLLHAIRHLV